MTDKMREAIWGAHDTARNKAWREEPGTFDTLDAFRAGAAWQAAQSVPVVGEPVAWVRRHPDGALTTEFLEDAVIEPVRRKSGAWIPLHLRPTPFIPEAELERLRKNEERYYYIRDAGLRDAGFPANEITRRAQDEAIDAAIAAEGE